MKVTIVDSIMGSGKTSWCIDFMNQEYDRNFLYITPFLDEIERMKSAVTRNLISPVNKGSGKLSNLNHLLNRQEDIAATHELFKHLDAASMQAIREGSYTLVLDEVLEVISPLNFKKDDLKLLLDSECITIDAEGFISWNPEKHDYDTSFNELKSLAEKHQLLCINEIILLWQYPPEIFQLFDEVYVLTYLFESSILAAYFKLYSIEYETKSIKDGCLVEYYEPDTKKYDSLITVYDGDMNKNFLSKPKTNPLSKTWYTKKADKNDIGQLKKNLNNYFRNICKAKAGEILWTTFKDYKPKLQGKGYTERFISCSCRATNAYAETSVLAYCVNVHLHPSVQHFFQQRNIYIDENRYALAEMIQWIWRSRIRNGEPVSIYIPAQRMRYLLYRWMGISPRR